MNHKIRNFLFTIYSQQTHGIRAYVIATMVVSVALVLRLAIAPLEAGVQYITFFPAVTLTALVAGFWPGVFAAAIGMLLATFILTFPYFSFSIANIQNSLWSNPVFFTDCLVVCFSIEALHRLHSDSLLELDESKRAEQKMRDGEANLQATLDNLPFLTWLKDTEGRYITINRVFANYLRLQHHEQAIGKTDLELQPRELAEKYRADDALVMAERKQKHVEEKAFDGKNIHWVETYKTPIIDKEGKLLGTVGMARDITERKNSEQALRLQSEITANASEAISLTKASDGTIFYTNRRFETLFGYNADELIGKHVSILNAPTEKSPQETAAEIMDSLEKSGAWHGELLNRRKDGTTFWTFANVSSFNHPEQGTLLISYQSDITEQKRAEQEILALNIKLAHEVEARTSELAALTAHTLKIAEEEKANLARELHDEIGSTLACISMEVGRLRKKFSAPDMMEEWLPLMGLLSHAIEIKQTVISRLYPATLEDFGLVTAIKSLVHEFERYSGMSVELTIPGGQPADMEQSYALAAYRITQECLTNIAKHADASKVQIELVSDGDFLNLTIRDNGKGMSGKSKANSHGIFGMKERARHLGGSMKIIGEEGKGTTAHLRLPLKAHKPKGRMRVLVVDDHAIVRDAIRQLLNNQSDDLMVAGEAADGEAGVEMAISSEWDVVLLDVNMPKKRGIKALEEIRAAKPGLPVIMLSSHGEDEYGALAIAKGASGYIEKGATDGLIEAMRKAVLLQSNV